MRRTTKRSIKKRNYTLDIEQTQKYLKDTYEYNNQFDTIIELPNDNLIITPVQKRCSDQFELEQCISPKINNINDLKLYCNNNKWKIILTVPKNSEIKGLTLLKYENRQIIDPIPEFNDEIEWILRFESGIQFDQTTEFVKYEVHLFGIRNNEVVYKGDISFFNPNKNKLNTKEIIEELQQNTYNKLLTDYSLDEHPIDDTIKFQINNEFHDLERVTSFEKKESNETKKDYKLPSVNINNENITIPMRTRRKSSFGNTKRFDIKSLQNFNDTNIIQNMHDMFIN